ncbi:MAG TPA: type II toxin-antitoxin system VapC family toxin [Acidimicrobiales bacterium]|nr:type II toxin-antitoxin system VapC family toxin [Acidimicrobiales bacterium]
MDIVDANVLLYAVNTDARHHARARQWLDGALSGEDTVAFCWIVLLAFLRLVTKVGLFPRPMTSAQALDRVEAWLGSAAAVVVEPTVGHPRIVRSLLDAVGTGGNLVNDAHVAALAIEHRCGIVSFDNDFGRFPGVRWHAPPG